MRQIGHIFLKDVWRHWPELSASSALVAAYGWKEALGRNRPEELVAFAGLDYRALSSFVGIALPVAWSFLIIRVIQGESLVGDRQFWVTRPYEWRSLLAEKALFVLGFVQAPVFILQIALLRRAGFHPAHYLEGLLSMQLMLCLFLVMPAVTLAVVTETIVQALLGTLIIALFMTGMATLSDYIPSSSFPGPADNVIEILFIVICVSVIVLQYARRRIVAARLLIVALGGALLLVLVATPYKTIVAHEFPPLPPGEQTPFRLSLLPGRGSTSAAPGNEREVQVRIPLSVAGLAPDSIIAVDGYMAELHARGGRSWNSGWVTNGQEIYPELSRAEVSLTLKKPVYESMQSSLVTLRLSLAYTLFRDGNRREFVIPDSAVDLPGVGVCSAGRERYPEGFRCIAPLRRPESFLVTTDMSANTCPLGKSEVRPAPGQIARSWVRGGSGPADFGIDPVVAFHIFSYAWPGGEMRVTQLCPGTPVVLSNPLPIFQSQTQLLAEDIRLLDYGDPRLDR